MNTQESYFGNAPNPSTMYLTPTGPDVFIKHFKTSKSIGEEGIRMHLLKQLSLEQYIDATSLMQ